MNKLRIGLIVYAESKPTDGGGYSYYETLLKGINDFNFDPNIEVINVVLYKLVKPTIEVTKPSIFIKVGFGMQLKSMLREKSIKNGFPDVSRRHSMVRLLVKFVLDRRNRKVEKVLRSKHIDLIYYLKPEFHILNYPFIATHWDIAHKTIHAFPEVALNKNYEIREHYYLYTLNKAFLILCESEAGVKELKNYYSFLDSKIKVLPIFAGNVISEKTTPTLDDEVLSAHGVQRGKFFVYPAQFWVHKNHYSLIIAFEKFLAETKDVSIKLVLCGSDHGNAAYIKEVIKSLSLEDSVVISGFVANAELNVLYRHAISLIMPTLLGPTNMPIIEAAHLNCPVICSNLLGHKEILGDCALYVDPLDSDCIKAAMLAVLDPERADALRVAASNRIQHSPFVLDKSLSVLNNILIEAIPCRRTWGN